MSECRTCLVYHIDKGLDLVPTEAANNVRSILTREGSLDQERKLMWIERASDQEFKGWRVEVKKEG